MPADLNTSGISQGDHDASLNNLSHVSGFKNDLNTSNSRRNLSSRSNAKAKKNFQVNINEDIKLIERIETVLNQISANHNKVCPFCVKSNEKFISSLYSNFNSHRY